MLAVELLADEAVDDDGVAPDAPTEEIGCTTKSVLALFCVYLTVWTLFVIIVVTRQLIHH